MPDCYKCHKCYKIFSTKQNLDYHLYKSKKKCTDKNCIIENGVKKYCCNICDKKYSRLYYLNNHKKIHIKEKEEKIIQVEKEDNSQEKIDQMSKKIYDLEKKLAEHNANTTINIIDNSKHIDNSQNIVVNKYVVNAFSKENVDYISDEKMKEYAKNPLEGVPRLVRDINFVKDHPENHNVLLVNKKDKDYKIFNGSGNKYGEKFSYCKENEVVNLLVINSTDRIYYFSEGCDDFSDEMKKKIDDAIDEIDKKINNPKCHKKDQFMNRIYKILISGTHMIKDIDKEFKDTQLAEYDYKSTETKNHLPC